MIDLYIANQKVEFPENFAVLFNHTLEDRTNPTVVKNSFSKTLELPGTDNNNKIFGTFFRNDRYQDYGSRDWGAYFDPSKRASFQIFENGSLVQEGYCKLDRVKKTGEQILYYVSLFGGLGEFFYNLTYRTDGEEKKLSDLDFGKELGFTINKDTVKEAWDALPGSDNSKWGTINFAPAYNGIPNDFDSEDVLINTRGSGIFTTEAEDGEKQYGTNDGFILGKLNKSYDEWQMRDLRSYLQRPVLRVKSLIQACCDPKNNSGDTNNGYVVDLDKDFFSSSNPYYEDAWITLPLLNTDAEEEITTSASQVGFSNISATSGATGQTPLVISGGELPVGSNNVVDFSDYPFSYINVTANVQLRVDGINQNGRIFMDKQDYWNSWLFWKKKRVSYGAFFAQVLAYDADNNKLLAGSGIYCFLEPNALSDGETDVTIQDFLGSGSGKYTPLFNAPYQEVRGYFDKNSGDGSHIFTSTEGHHRVWQISINKCPKVEHMRFEIRLSKAWCAKGDNTSASGWDATAKNFFNSGATVSYQKPGTLVNSGYGSIALTAPSSVSSDSSITKGKLLSTEFTPADYLLAYSKMFGLYWFKDRYENKVYCRTRNNYFYPVVENIDQYIDHSQGYDIKPFVFDHKWYSMTQETPESYFAEKYMTDYGRTYGQQKINTNYNFDSETKEMFENIPYQNAIMARASSIYFNDYQDYEQRYIPGFFIDGFQGTLFNGSEEYDISYSQNLVNWASQSPWYGAKNYDFMPRPCFYELDGSERKPVDISNVFLFFNGKTTTPGHFYLTDDNYHMISLNEEVCWLYTESNVDEEGNIIALGINAIPEFNRYILSANQIAKSWDFGDPKELYVDNYTLGERNNIYDQFWKAFLSDQYNVNSRVVTCYVLWERVVTEELQRRFWWFDNAIWMLNRIIDYDINSFKPTKCEFIKVMDIANYTSGKVTFIKPKPSSKDDDGYDPEHTCPIINFQDPLTKSYAVGAWDRNGDGELDMCEAAAVETLGTVFKGSGIHYFDEIVYFTGIEGIEPGAFSGCTNLDHIILPGNVDYIGEDAFKDCTAMTYIQVDSTKPPVLGAGAFDNTNECPIYIDCNYLADFQREWPQYAYRFQCSDAPTGETLIMATAITLNVADEITDFGQATYTLEPTDANNIYIKWVSSNPNIATIDENGRITANANGYTTICVYETVAGLNDCKQVHIIKTPTINSSIDVTPSSKTVGYESGTTTFNITTLNII